MDKEWIPESVNRSSAPSSLKITDLRVTNINGLPKHCILLKLYTNQGIVGYGEVRDASSATYALMLKSRILGENPLNVEKLFRRIRQFGGPSRQGGGVSGIEIALWDIVGKAYGVPVWQLLGGKYRDRVRVYCDTDVEGRHTGLDMGRALKARMDMGFTFLKMDLGIELLFGEEGCLKAPDCMLREIEQYSMKAIRHQKGSIDRELMLGKNYEVFTIPHYATGIHITEKGLDALEAYVRDVRSVIGYKIPRHGVPVLFRLYTRQSEILRGRTEGKIRAGSGDPRDARHHPRRSDAGLLIHVRNLSGQRAEHALPQLQRQARCLPVRLHRKDLRKITGKNRGGLSEHSALRLAAVRRLRLSGKSG